MKAGVYQCDGAGLTPPQRLEKLAAAVDGKGLDLVVCPELFLTGYNVGAELHSQAEAANGELAGQLCAKARALRCAIVAGLPEIEGRTVYNSAICVDAEGKSLARHRKLAIPPGFERDWFTAGSEVTMFMLAGIKCALLICYDIEFPETVRAACLAGAEVVIAPTALGKQWDQVATKVVPSRAFENGCYMLYANHAGSEADLTYAGLSCIVGPDGRDIARADEREQLICATVDAAKVLAARQRLPYLAELTCLKPKLA